MRIPLGLEADPSLHSEAVYIEADRFFHQKILLAIGRRTLPDCPSLAPKAKDFEFLQLRNATDNEQRRLCLQSATGNLARFPTFVLGRWSDG